MLHKLMNRYLYSILGSTTAQPRLVLRAPFGAVRSRKSLQKRDLWKSFGDYESAALTD